MKSITFWQDRQIGQTYIWVYFITFRLIFYLRCCLCHIRECDVKCALQRNCVLVVAKFEIWQAIWALYDIFYIHLLFYILFQNVKCEQNFIRDENVHDVKFQIWIYRIFGTITSIFELWLWPISKDFWLTTPLHVTDLLSGNVLRYFAPPIPW